MNNPYELVYESEQCAFLLSRLNETTAKTDATFQVDIMSGAYRFSDEVPELEHAVEEQNILPLITLLRKLWAYRISLVRGNPRKDLECWWGMAKQRAPKWAGFANLRCSEDAVDYAERCSQHFIRFERDAIALEERLKKSK